MPTREEIEELEMYLRDLDWTADLSDDHRQFEKKRRQMAITIAHARKIEIRQGDFDSIFRRLAPTDPLTGRPREPWKIW